MFGRNAKGASADTAPAVAAAATPDQQRWAALAGELGPSQSLTAAEDAAKSVVSTVALAGTVLTGFGLLATSNLTSGWVVRSFSVVAVVASLTALVLALTYLQLRVTRLNLKNLVEVRDWYESREQGLKRVQVAQVLLLVALGCASAAALVALLAPAVEEPAVTLTGRPDSEGTVVAGRVTCDRCAFEVVEVAMTVEVGPRRETCFLAKVEPSQDGKFDVVFPGCKVPDGGAASVSVDGRVAASLP